jgi:hypothetical protein
VLTDAYCSDCGHAKIQHVKALGFCVNCHTLLMAGLWSGRVCRRVFASIFSQDELEKLTHVAKDQFGQWDVCAVCEAYWMEHNGALCPSGNSTFKPLVGNS